MGQQVTTGGLPRRNVSFTIPDLCRWRKTCEYKTVRQFFYSSPDN
ncbi:hypothetical protein NC99_17360 [Sunxiuqinia dokdonensis]|uniref:Uncharacterized protein n=1 Tax=Sunxiuqinia dokdonensis TaxID=1409788 RepID=A0A0L8VAR9_9BACT|nr:hypothetical protein NC99_17360 [Sunxiuqinia dokdonensis]